VRGAARAWPVWGAASWRAGGRGSGKQGRRGGMSRQRPWRQRRRRRKEVDNCWESEKNEGVRFCPNPSKARTLTLPPPAPPARRPRWPGAAQGRPPGPRARNLRWWETACTKLPPPPTPRPGAQRPRRTGPPTG